MLKKFKEKIREEGRTYKWWHGKYIKKVFSYNYTMKQLSGYNEIQEEVRAAMYKFLKEE